MLITYPGGLSAWRGRGRGLFPPAPTNPQNSPPRLVGPVTPFSPPNTPPQPIGRGRGRGFPPPSPSTPPPPLEDCSPPRRHHEAPLRQPCTMPLCLWLLGHFPPPTPYSVHDLEAPHIIMTYSLPNRPCFASSSGNGVAVPITIMCPLRCFSMTLLLPIHHKSTHTQSHLTLMCPSPIPMIMMLMQSGIRNPNPSNLHISP